MAMAMTGTPPASLVAGPTGPGVSHRGAKIVPSARDEMRPRFTMVETPRKPQTETHWKTAAQPDVEAMGAIWPFAGRTAGARPAHGAWGTDMSHVVHCK